MSIRSHPFGITNKPIKQEASCRVLYIYCAEALRYLKAGRAEMGQEKNLFHAPPRYRKSHYDSNTSKVVVCGQCC